MNQNNSLEWYKTYNRNIITEYFGKGILKFEEGNKCSCKFEVIQLVNGNIIFLCNILKGDFEKVVKYSSKMDFKENSSLEEIHKAIYRIQYIMSDSNIFDTVSDFEGTTSENLKIKGNELSFLNMVTDSSSVKITFSLKSLEVNELPFDNLQFITYNVTNFKLEGRGFELDLEGCKKVVIEKNDEYKESIQLLKSFNNILPTCKIIIEIDNEIDIEKSKKLAQDLCDIISIAKGTKIQWINYKVYNKENKIISRKYENKVTKTYNKLGLIKPEDLKEFIECAYLGFINRPELFNNNRKLIYSYLDAKAENDYIQLRGLKNVTVMDMLTSLLLELNQTLESNQTINEKILEDGMFKKLKKSIKNHIKEIAETNGVDSKLIPLIYEKISELNRVSYKEIILNLLKSETINVEDDVKLFIKCRNSLVHNGEFYCITANDKERAKCPPLPSRTSEYLFIQNFIDNILLKLLGYRGNPIYLDDQEKSVKQKLYEHTNNQ